MCGEWWRVSVNRAEYAKVRGQVLACAACPLHLASPRVPVQSLSSTSPSSLSAPLFAVVGEAPGAQEARLQRPFVGPSGKLLRALLRDVGFEPEDVAWMNAVSCWPLKAGATRAPSEKEMKSCRGNLIRQLEVIEVEYALLVGATALKAFRGDVKLTDVHGRVFKWLDKWTVMPIMHPAAVLRDRSLKEVVKRDLITWRRVLNRGSTEPTGGCCKCIDVATHWDRDNMPYCTLHWGRYEWNWMRERKKWPSPGAGTQVAMQLDIS